MVNRQTLVTYLIIGLTLLGAVALDWSLPIDYPTTLAYAIPILLAALLSTPRVVAATGGLAVVIELFGDVLENVPRAILPFYSLSLLVITLILVYLAVRIAHQKQLINNLYHQAAFDRERWQTTVESMPNLVVLSDADGRLAYINRAYAVLTGYQLDPNVSLEDRLNLLELRGADGAPLDVEDLPVRRAIQSNQEVSSVEMVLRTADGGEVFTSWNVSPLHDSNGKVVGAVAAGRDVTERRKLTRERERLLAEAERNRERMEETLHMIAHDIRQPLTVIRGHLQILRRGVADGNVELAKRSFDTLEISTKRLEVMIRDLVDSVRLETNQITMECQTLELGRFIYEALTRMSGTLDVGDVGVEIEAPVEVRADPSRLERVIQNLVGNAIKYSGSSSGVTITVKSQESEAIVAVTDHGPGIQPEDLGRIFERGFRAETTRKTGGLGLGLYISRLIVEAHGGRIWAESEVSKGTVFFFTLPVSRNSD